MLQQKSPNCQVDEYPSEYPSEYLSDKEEIYKRDRGDWLGLSRPARRELIARGVYHCHIPHDNTTERATITVCAAMVRVKIQNKRIGGGIRGTVAGFSAASRKRLLELINQWRNMDNVVFITLTYHLEYAEDWREWKRQLDNFLKRLKYHYPHISGIWRMEYQKRGAPHFHLIVAGMTGLLSDIRDDVTRWWGEIAHQESEYKGKYATNCQRIDNRRHAMYYVSKYVGKVSDEEDREPEHGRVWGKFGEIDTSATVISVPIATARVIKQFMEILLRTHGHPYASALENSPPGVGWAVFGVGDEKEKVTIYWWDMIDALLHYK